MQDSYSVDEVAQRHKCARSTIFRKMKDEGLPRGGRNGTRSLSISGAELYKWELVHMPWLHAKDADREAQARMEEDTKWNQTIAEHEGRKAGWRKKAQVLTPKKGWDEVRRDIKKKRALAHPDTKAGARKKPN